MKRKTYITPAVEIVSCEGVMMLCGSGVSSSFGSGISYGGVDTDGTVDAGVRANVWDDDSPFDDSSFD